MSPQLCHHRGSKQVKTGHFNPTAGSGLTKTDESADMFRDQRSNLILALVCGHPFAAIMLGVFS